MTKNPSSRVGATKGLGLVARWVRLAWSLRVLLLATAVVAVVALLVVPHVLGDGPPTSDRASEKGEEPTSDGVGQPIGSTAGAGAPAPADDSPAPAGSCVDPTDGSGVDCTVRTAALRLEAESCNPDVFLARRGLDPGLEALNLRFDVVDDSCYVTPDERARSAGAGASDIAQVGQGAILPALRECARTDSGPSISCADPHEIEWVGGWWSAESTPSHTDCLGPARQYTGRQLTGADPLVVGLVTREDENGVRAYRCVLRAPGYVLAGTVRGLGGSPLPTAP